MEWITKDELQAASAGRKEKDGIGKGCLESK